MDQKIEIVKLLQLLTYDITWLSIDAPHESDRKALQRMLKVVMEIANALDGETINAEKIAWLLYTEDIQLGLLDILSK